MPLSTRILKILWGKAGATCSFPNCRRQLIANASQLDGEVVLGETAHIVAQTLDGPRGRHSPPGGEIDGYDNLILLCGEHHALIDGQPETYSVVGLVQMKKDHEHWVNTRLSADNRYQQVYSPIEYVTEKIYSTLFPVIQMPRWVYLAPANFTMDKVRAQIAYPSDSFIFVPFIMHEKNLISFTNLSDPQGPFHEVVDHGAAEVHIASDWWSDPDLYRMYVALLNQSLTKFAKIRGLRFDKDHHRYYFEPIEKGIPRTIICRSLGGKMTPRKVVWCPHFRHSGEAKKFWEHMAVSLRFHKVSESGWCLSVRPERRFTRDGFVPLTPKSIGRKSTKKQSHMYNINVLTEVNFWRAYLSARSPRFIFKFGTQNLIVSTTMMNTDVSWPGVPKDIALFRDAQYQDNLLTYVEYESALASEVDEFDEWDENELGFIDE
jgi:hypothetical protein